MIFERRFQLILSETGSIPVSATVSDQRNEFVH